LSSLGQRERGRKRGDKENEEWRNIFKRDEARERERQNEENKGRH
jgi:hypothetical protein